VFGAVYYKFNVILDHFSTTNHLTRSLLSSTQNALKLTYNYVEFKGGSRGKKRGAGKGRWGIKGGEGREGEVMICPQTRSGKLTCFDKYNISERCHGDNICIADRIKARWRKGHDNRRTDVFNYPAGSFKTGNYSCLTSAQQQYIVVSP